MHCSAESCIAVAVWCGAVWLGQDWVGAVWGGWGCLHGWLFCVEGKSGVAGCLVGLCGWAGDWFLY